MTTPNTPRIHEVERLPAYRREANSKDALYIIKAVQKLLRLKKRFKNWRGVEQEIHVNHGHMSALVLHGTIPRSKEIRRALGLPAVLPSEKITRKKKFNPPLYTWSGWILR